MNKRILVVGVLLVAPLVVVLVASLGRNPSRIVSPLIGKPAPAFKLPIVGGGELSYQDLRGKPLIVNFWATWCAPCYMEHGTLVRTARRVRPDASVIGIVYEDDEARVQRFLREEGSSYPVLMDPDSRTAIAYGVYGVPETFFVDASGTVVAKHDLPLDDRLMNGFLKMILPKVPKVDMR